MAELQAGRLDVHVEKAKAAGWDDRQGWTLISRALVVVSSSAPATITGSRVPAATTGSQAALDVVSTSGVSGLVSWGSGGWGLDS